MNKFVISCAAMALMVASLTAQTPSTTETARTAAAAELVAKNKIVAEQNVVLERANKLFAEKAYFEASKIYLDVIKKYTETVPEHPGLPSVVINYSVSTRFLAVDAYNAAIKLEAANLKQRFMDTAGNLFTNAASSAKDAVNLARQADVNPRFSNEDTKAQLLRALANRVDSIAMMAQFVDRSVSDETHQAFLQ